MVLFVFELDSCSLLGVIYVDAQVQGLAIVTALVLTPYTSFWQPRQPTYNPVEVSLELSHPEVNQGKPYYVSPRFNVKGYMRVSF